MASIAEFENPPVVETILGLQFSTPENFTPAHIGVFWHECLGEEWKNVKVEPPLDKQIERLDAQGIFSAQRLSLDPVFPSPRLQFTNASDERMIQLQDTWFVYNWRKRKGRYPTYRKLLPDFLGQFSAFLQFVEEKGLGEIKLNQWEVTYINHILKGTVWNDIQDWESVIPEIFGPAAQPPCGILETVNTNWTVLLDDDAGRLRVNIRHVRLRGDENEEAIDFRLTTRGPIKSTDEKEIKSALGKGHDAIVRTFVEATSAKAQKYWRRTS